MKNAAFIILATISIIHKIKKNTYAYLVIPIKCIIVDML